MNSLWNWLSQTNPNVVIPIVSVPVLWLIGKIRGDQKSSWRNIVTSVIDNLTAELLDHYDAEEGSVEDYLKTARAYIDKRVWAVLTKRGVPRNKWTEAVLHEAIEKGTAWLGNEIAKLTMPKLLEELHRRLQTTNEILKSSVATPNPGSVSP